MAEKLLPELIITDIRMPELDGLDLTERLKVIMPCAKVIIITGYDEFKYAQRAIKIGAYNFILKPIDNIELHKVIRAAVAEIIKEQDEKRFQKSVLQENDRLQKKVDASVSELRKKLIIDVIEDLYTADEMAEKSLSLGLSFSQYVLAIIKPDPPFSGAGYQNNQLSGFIKSVQATMDAIEKSPEFTVLYCWLNNMAVMIFLPVKIENDHILSKKVLDACEQVAAMLNEDSTTSFSLGVSNPNKGVGGMISSYREALSALDCRFFNENKTIIQAGALNKESFVNEYLMIKRINQLYEGLRNEGGSIAELIDNFFGEIRNNTSTHAEYVKGLLTDICMNALGIMYERNVFPGEDMKCFMDLRHEIHKLSGMNEACDYVKGFIMEIYERIHEENKKYGHAVKEVIEYLNANYDRKIPLQEIADLVQLSPAHLSRLIKKETGENFIDLFNRIKINIAVKLLKETNLKVYEIAARVGIDNYAYFYQLFKKLTGVSPKDYAK